MNTVSTIFQQQAIRLKLQKSSQQETGL